MNEQIPPTSEFSDKYNFYYEFGDFDLDWSKIHKYARDFAKAHVEAALKAASESAQLSYRKYDEFGKATEVQMGQEITTERENEYYGISESSILSAYPLDKIT